MFHFGEADNDSKELAYLVHALILYSWSIDSILF